MRESRKKSRLGGWVGGGAAPPYRPGSLRGPWVSVAPRGCPFCPPTHYPASFFPIRHAGVLENGRRFEHSPRIALGDRRERK